MMELLFTMRKQCMQGLVLEDNPRNKTVFVAEVVPGGHADRSGQVEVRAWLLRLQRFSIKKR